MEIDINIEKRAAALTIKSVLLGVYCAIRKNSEKMGP